MFDLLHTIKDMLFGFFEAVGTFFNFIGDLLTDIVDVFVKATAAMGNALVWIGSMIPASALAVFGSILTVAVIYKFLGREG